MVCMLGPPPPELDSDSEGPPTLASDDSSSDSDTDESDDEDFNPDDVPTLSTLLNEIDRHHAAGGGGMRVLCAGVISSCVPSLILISLVSLSIAFSCACLVCWVCSQTSLNPPVALWRADFP